MELIRVDKVGKKYGKLTVIGFSHVGKSNHRYWNCRCDCGRDTVVGAVNLQSGHTTSCGCSIKTQGGISKKSRAYIRWSGMMQRCHNPSFHRFKDYGGKGITVCKRWQDFQTFLADMGEPPASCTIERLDNSKGYSPDNCKWATQKEQQRNRSSNVLITHNGRTQCMAAWAEETGINLKTISYRLHNGWSVERALTTPIGQQSKGLKPRLCQ